MPRKLTQEEVDLRYIDCDIKLYGPYLGSNNNTEHICYCGKLFVTSPEKIWRKTTRSCGCKTAFFSSEKQTLTQQEAIERCLSFGIKMVGDYTKAHVNTEFECPYCGNIFVTSPIKIWTGHTQSCGCYQKIRAAEGQRIDIAGRKFGKLTAIYRLDEMWKGCYLWYCICDCGKTKNVSSNYLMAKRVLSCGNCKNFRNGKQTSSMALLLHKMIGRGIHNFKTKIDGESAWVDIAFSSNNKKICVEYDEWYWHGHKSKQDQQRIEKLIENGWYVIQVLASNNSPTQDQLDQAIQTVTENKDSKHYMIVLDGWGKGDTFQSIRERKNMESVL